MAENGGKNRPLKWRMGRKPCIRSLFRCRRRRLGCDRGSAPRSLFLRMERSECRPKRKRIFLEKNRQHFCFQNNYASFFLGDPLRFSSLISVDFFAMPFFRKCFHSHFRSHSDLFAFAVGVRGRSGPPRVPIGMSPDPECQRITRDLMAHEAAEPFPQAAARDASRRNPPPPNNGPQGWPTILLDLVPVCF